ncbi:PaaI family thioesterase [Haloactinopolyspora sp.]|uniref:PaaI family thioesterase n=1 Tax=Haloactinopolyspora sp. TaxID=1966353 RepID=UPI00261257CF|nr:PaaI family thioesterase [Haloactinopolyspora sp.]
MTSNDDVNRDLVESLLTGPAYHKWLGLELLDAKPGQVVIGMAGRPEFCGNTDGTYIHGGLLATLADIAADFALVTQVGIGLPTIDLRMDYLRPAKPGDYLRAVGTVVRRGRTLGVADALVANGDGVKLAVGRGLYSTATP